MMSRPGGPEAVSRFTVRLPAGRSYPVVVGPGASREAPDHVQSLPVSRCVVVTDSNLESTHAAAVAALLRERGQEPPVISFPAGEANKTRAVKESIEDRMVALRCGRDTAIVAVGGGVTGDLAGFVAATYMRGIPHVQVPTSLLAMVDASIGGKTGVDHPLGKNLIGAFHHPAAVLTDPEFLRTLPLAEFRSGLAEIVKSGVIADEHLFAALEAEAAALASGDASAAAAPVARAVAVKVEVVSADEREADLRKILNFGHTIGHALEQVTGWSLSHGEAISIGMAAESRIAVRMGLLEGAAASRIEGLLAALGLPVKLPPGLAPGRVLAAASTDKKAREGRLEFVLPKAIGEMASGDRGVARPVPDAEVEESLREIESGR